MPQVVKWIGTRPKKPQTRGKNRKQKQRQKREMEIRQRERQMIHKACADGCWFMKVTGVAFVLFFLITHFL